MGFANIIRRIMGPLRIEHVRYVSKSAINPRDKAIAMARSMGRADLIARPER